MRLPIRFSIFWVTFLWYTSSPPESFELGSDCCVIWRRTNQVWLCSVFYFQWPWPCDVWAHGQSVVSRRSRLCYIITISVDAYLKRAKSKTHVNVYKYRLVIAHDKVRNSSMYSYDLLYIFFHHRKCYDLMVWLLFQNHLDAFNQT